MSNDDSDFRYDPDDFGLGPKEMFMRALRAHAPPQRTVYAIWGYNGEPIREKFELVAKKPYSIRTIWMRQSEPGSILRSIKTGSYEQLGLGMAIRLLEVNDPPFESPLGKFSEVQVIHPFFQKFGNEGFHFNSGGAGVPTVFSFDGAVTGIVIGGYMIVEN